MERVEPPQLVDQPVPVLTVEELRSLIKAAKGQTFEARRDEAIIRLFADTGIRLGEMAGLRVDDIDLLLAVAVVKGKGSRFRTVPYGDKTREALDRYRRQRMRHDDSHLEAWWLGRKGPLTDSGITQMLRRRAKEAGLESLHAHQFRHSFAHQWLRRERGRPATDRGMVESANVAALREVGRGPTGAGGLPQESVMGGSVKGSPIKLICGNCGKRAGVAELGPTPNGGHAWSVTTRRVIEGSRPDQPSDWMEAGIYVDPKARRVPVVTCPYCNADLKLVLEDLEKSPDLKHIGRPEKDRMVLDPY